jgi:hypothetical protein
MADQPALMLLLSERLGHGLPSVSACWCLPLVLDNCCKLLLLLLLSVLGCCLGGGVLDAALSPCSCTTSREKGACPCSSTAYNSTQVQRSGKDMEDLCMHHLHCLAMPLELNAGCNCHWSFPCAEENWLYMSKQPVSAWQCCAQCCLTISYSSASKKCPHGPTTTGWSSSNSLNHWAGMQGLGQRRSSTSPGRNRRSAARPSTMGVCGTAACTHGTCRQTRVLGT